MLSKMSLPKVISQETYDLVVLENVKEFDNTIDEAVEEATKEFEAQGVLLTNIIKNVSLNPAKDAVVHPILEALEQIKLAATGAEGTAPLATFTEQCKVSLPHRVMAASNGAYPCLLGMARDYKMDGERLLPVVQALQALADGNPDILDNEGVGLIKDLMEQWKEDLTSDIMEYLARWCHSCNLKHEANRAALFDALVPSSLVASLTGCSATDHKMRILATLRAIRSFTLDDDIRTEFGKAHENCRYLVEEERLIPVALALIKGAVENNSGSVAGEALATLSCACVRAEYCQQASDAGALQTINSILAGFPDSAVLSKQGVALVATLAGDDKVKAKVMEAGTAPLLAAAMDRHQLHPGVCSACCSAVSMLSLRHPQHAAELIECGAAAGVLQAMKQHPKEKQLQKMGCLAVRNMSSRSPTAAAQLRELGAEQLVLTAVQAHGPAVADLAKSALRDIGAEVTLEEQWRGKGHELQQ